MSRSADTPATDSVLDSIVGHELSRARLKLADRVKEALSVFGVTPAQFSTLTTIEQAPGLRQTDLARALDIEPPRMVVLLNRLEEQGLVARVRSQTDKRAYGVHLTRKAEQQLPELKATVLHCDRSSTAMLTAEERAQLITLLKKITSG